MNAHQISDFEYFKDGFGIITDGNGQALRKYIKATFIPERGQYEVKSPVYPNVCKFVTKAEANKAAKKMHLPLKNIKKFGNRFETGWAICLDGHHSDCFVAAFE